MKIKKQSKWQRLDFSSFRSASESVRRALGIDRLTKDLLPTVKDAVAKHESRQGVVRNVEQAPNKYGSMLLKRISEPVRALDRRLYRVSQSSWAGGDHTCRVTLSDTPEASGESQRAWSSNGKWSGNNSIHRINVSPRWLSEVANVPGLASAGDMLTTHAEYIGHNFWKASWIEQGRGFEVRAVTGYIYYQNGWHHAKTQRGAVQAAAKRAELLRRLERKQALKAMGAREIVARYGDLMVTRSDSLKAGNCPTGTDTWIEKNMPGRNSATVAEIISLDPDNKFVRLAAMSVILRNL